MQSINNPHVVLNLFQHRIVVQSCDPESSSGRRRLIATRYETDTQAKKMTINKTWLAQRLSKFVLDMRTLKTRAVFVSKAAHIFINQVRLFYS